MAQNNNVPPDSSFAARLRWLSADSNTELVRRGARGVEKESLRITAAGRLSPRPHPKSLGAALTHPYITTDYSEALPEFVTPPHAANWETLQFLCDLHAFAHRRLDDELLWPASMPCVLSANEEIPIAEYGSSNLGLMKTVYRRGLGYRYGRAMQAIAGVHFNYSPPSDFWPAYRDHVGTAESEESFRSASFMGLVRNYRRYAWLVTYLFGASPAVCRSFRPEGHELLEEFDDATWYAPFATSLRMSDLGYRNKTQARLSISANSPAEYVAGLASAVSTLEPRYAEIGVKVDGEYRQLNANILQIENEYYSTIRPKPTKSSSARPTIALRTRGIEYVEIRTLDLNPTDPVGINQGQLRFLEALLLFCLLADSPQIDAVEHAEIDLRDLTVAREGRRPDLVLADRGRRRGVAAWGSEIVDRVGEVAALLDKSNEGYVAAVELARAALSEPERTPSAALLRALESENASFSEYGHELARAHHEYFAALPLPAERDEWFAGIARQSLAEQESLERATTEPFDAYLSRYFSTV